MIFTTSGTSPAPHLWGRVMGEVRLSLVYEVAAWPSLQSGRFVHGTGLLNRR
ncbi:hypothetical protein ACTAQJ_12825 [Arthrobacter sp. alpha11c]